MAVALDATPGGTYANSYISVATAQTYIDDERLDAAPAAWVDGTTDQRSKALITATKVINGLPFPGRQFWWGPMLPGVPRQALFFPRTVDGYLGALFIPKPVQRATVELALYLIARPPEDDQRRALQNQGVSEIQMGRNLREQYRAGAGALIDYCPAAKDLLRQVGYGAPIMMR